MAHEVKIHDAQVAILRELLFHPEAGFAQMQKPTGLTSDHFNFHMTRLTDLGYVEKVKKGLYTFRVQKKMNQLTSTALIRAHRRDFARVSMKLAQIKQK